jgi:hypothetical protein
VIYYTCNREKPEFESRIMQRLWKAIKPLRLPLISVSHKPIDFGHNICVGDIGLSGQNIFRQWQTGAIAAKTRFVCNAEADHIYPREYFQFVPERDDTFYLAIPVWVAFAQRGRTRRFSQKVRGSESAMIVGRDTLIARIDEMMVGRGQWGTADMAGGARLQNPIDRRHAKRSTFTISTPIVTFKTDRNIHRNTPHDRSNPLQDLPGIGNIAELLRAFGP